MDAVEISKQQRVEAVASLKRYFEENLDPIGDLPTGQLLNYFLEEIGPIVYNQAIQDAQARLQLVVADLTGDLYAEELQYWPRLEAKRRGRR
ncbi:DUF2164 domain-containing protein [Acidicapsa dinghuensis]|uniref:DUF2164 domain-containing protein n=1 Tax=Acidicapsa dinghuensis TaxID=2218256 RepID=A0ABW1EML4_9BACT|nr:DUF2164 domain-containing protein [Acidicapsa dinghuensis]